MDRLRISRYISRRNNIFLALIGCYVKPSVFIVGAQKAGTSSLFDGLNQLQGVIKTDTKEVAYFDRDENYSKGKTWYHSHFTGRYKAKALIDATPEYLYKSYVAQRIYRYDPNAKIIISLRNPVERAYSAWNMYKQFGEETGRFSRDFRAQLKKINPDLHEKFYANDFPSFKEVVEDGIRALEVEKEDSFGIVARGLYYSQVLQYMNLFNKENLHVMFYEDFRANYKGCLREIMSFLCFDKQSEISRRAEKNVRKYTSTMSKEMYVKLENFYKEDRGKLADLLKLKDNELPW